MSNGNVAFTCQFDGEEDLFDATGGPVTADYTSDQIPWSPELPKQLVRFTVWPGWYERADEDLRLIDMGETFPVDQTVAKIAQPSDVRSPETFFIGSFDYRHDLWRAGCVVGLFSVYSSYHISSFPRHSPPTLTVFNRYTHYTTNESHLRLDMGSPASTLLGKF